MVALNSGSRLRRIYKTKLLVAIIKKIKYIPYLYFDPRKENEQLLLSRITWIVKEKTVIQSS